MNNFRDIKVWHKGMDLAIYVYEATEQLPASEKFNLISQMQRAAVSIPSNIAEGCGRHTEAAFKNFLSISLGSAYELETQAILSERLGFLPSNEFSNLHKQIIEVQKMTYGLMAKVA